MIRGRPPVGGPRRPGPSEDAAPQAEPADPAGTHAHQRRIDQDGEEGGGQNGVVDVMAHMAGVPCHLNQDERELADLRQAHTHEGGDGQRLSEEPDHPRPDHRLPNHDEQDEHGQNGQVVEHGTRIDEPTHGDEEERPEGVAQGQQARQGLVGIVRLADDEPGEESAQRERQPHRLGEGGGAEPDRERDQEKELGAPHPRHPVQDRGNHPRYQIEKGDEDDGGLAQRERDGDEAPGLELAQAGQQHHEGHRGEILDEGQPHHDAPVMGVQLAPVEQEPRQHHGAGHRDHDPHRQAGQHAPAQQHAGAGTHADEEEHRQRTSQQRDPLDPHEVADRELEADGEHEQYHADFREEVEGAGIVHGGARREGADEQAAEDIAQNERLTERPGQRASHHRGEEDECEVAEDLRIRDHGGNLACTSRPPRGRGGGPGLAAPLRLG